MIPFSFFCTAHYQLLRTTIPHTNCVHSWIFAISSDHVNYFCSIVDTSISKKKDLSWITFQWTFCDQLFKRLEYLCATKVWLHHFYLLNRLFYPFITVYHTFREQKLKICAKTNDVKVSILRQTFYEKNQSVLCLLHPTHSHRSTSIQQKYVLPSCILYLCFYCFSRNWGLVCIINTHIAKFGYEREHGSWSCICFSQHRTWKLKILSCKGEEKILVRNTFSSHPQ